jgi:hypothetical protein
MQSRQNKGLFVFSNFGQRLQTYPIHFAEHEEDKKSVFGLFLAQYLAVFRMILLNSVWLLVFS